MMHQFTNMWRQATLPHNTLKIQEKARGFIYIFTNNLQNRKIPRKTLQYSDHIHVHLPADARVSEKHISGLKVLPWNWRQSVAPKLWHLPMSLHSVETQNITILNGVKTKTPLFTVITPNIHHFNLPNSSSCHWIFSLNKLIKVPKWKPVTVL